VYIVQNQHIALSGTRKCILVMHIGKRTALSRCSPRRVCHPSSRNGGFDYRQTRAVRRSRDNGCHYMA
jgi:hypothetical protein